ncbi:terminase small subunit [Primorskyibacter sedentarius]|uniref:terminase small subunit n=1 Tax=Primorskyibacter sedentarius TaxID=745311 RepID=UPI003EBF40D5
MSGITPKQEIFAREYLVDLNATQAAIRAGYSPKCAESRGSKLMAIPAVAEYVSKLMHKRTSKLDLTADRVLQEIARIAFTDVSKLGDAVKASDKLKALELAGRYLKLFGAEEGERVLVVAFRDYTGRDSGIVFEHPGAAMAVEDGSN